MDQIEYIKSAKCIVVKLREIICDPEDNSGLIAGNKYDGARVQGCVSTPWQFDSRD